MSTHKLATALVPKIAGLKLEQIKIEQPFISMFMFMMSPSARCPLCARLASRIHSRYTRTIADLPWGTYIVRLHLRIRKFFCRVSSCSRRIFAERVPELAVSHARRTVRQGEIMRVVGLAVGARAGSRLAKRLQMLVSPSTMLRLLRQTPSLNYPTPRVLGVDDFARRKGTTYGTILVDLEKHRPIELLPSRSGDALAAWLREHPGIEIITRDRSTEYTRAITQGAPQAIQVADRFHVLGNLRDALERVLDRNRAKLGGVSLVSLPKETRESVSQTSTPIPGVAVVQHTAVLHQPEEYTSTEKLAQQVGQLRKRHLYDQVCQLHAQGVTIKRIAQQLQICRMTVYRYLRLDTDPTQRQLRSRHSMIDPYIPYLHQRWESGEVGCQNGGQLWKELRALGYPGSRKMLTVWVSQQRKKDLILPSSTPEKNHEQMEAQLSPPAIPLIPVTLEKPILQPKLGPAPSSRRLAWFLVRDPGSLNMKEQEVLAQVKELCQEASTAYRLVHNFHRIVKGRLANELDTWLKAAADSGIQAMQNFVVGIEKDKAAIVAALSMEWSNGQVEGQVNRIKLRKRQLYGRANFDLLRLYVLNDF